MTWYFILIICYLAFGILSACYTFYVLSLPIEDISTKDIDEDSLKEYYKAQEKFNKRNKSLSFLLYVLFAPFLIFCLIVEWLFKKLFKKNV